MNIEQQVAILKLQLIKLEQETTGNNARLTLLEGAVDQIDNEVKGISDRLTHAGEIVEPWVTLGKAEVEIEETQRVVDKGAESKSLYDDSFATYDTTMTEEEWRNRTGEYHRHVTNGYAVPDKTDPQTLTERQFIEPSDEWIDACMHGKNLPNWIFSRIRNRSDEYQASLHFIWTHGGEGVHSYYSNLNKGGCKK